MPRWLVLIVTDIGDYSESYKIVNGCLLHGFLRKRICSAFLRYAKMEKKREIVQYRERLDRTLASPDLTNDHMLKTLVKSQLLHSSKQEIEGNSIPLFALNSFN